MRGGWSLIVLAGLAAGCAEPQRPELGYLPPLGEPPSGMSVLVQQEPWLVWGNVFDHLQQQGLQLESVNEEARRLVVAYSGDPQPFVDCGWIVKYDSDDLERIPAAGSDASFPRRRSGEIVNLHRDLHLDAKAKVRIEPAGEHSLVKVDSVYRLTKTIRPETMHRPEHMQTVVFETGDGASFESGTRCQPNGQLERLVFEALPAVSLADRPLRPHRARQ